ncbi:MAG: mechanosensitive ion channel family protein [Desulfobulbaceae bacterium]|nr:mechanosensitive ion channel family protein [Desulfobulbaceae bacterium]
MKQKLFCLFFTVLLSCFFLFSSALHGFSQQTEPTKQQVIANQDTEPAAVPINNTSFRPALANWLHMLDKTEITATENSSVMAFAPQVPGDLARVFKPTDPAYEGPGVLYVLMLSIISICIGFLIVFAVKRIAQKGIKRLQDIVPPGNGRLECLWAGILRSVPTVTSLFLLAVSSTLVFLLFASSVGVKGRMLFQLIIGSVLIVIACSIISRIIFAPEDSRIRPLALNDSVAKPLHHAFATSTAVLLFGYLFLYFIRDLGAFDQTVSWLGIIVVSAVMAVFAYLVLYLRQPFAAFLRDENQQDDSSWMQNQLAAYWHIPALLYLLITWFITIGQILTGMTNRNGSFIISLFIVPIYFVLSHVGRTLIESVIDSLGLGAKMDNSDLADPQIIQDEQASIARQKAIVSKSHKIFRIILVVALTTWMLSLWGYDIPFAASAIMAIIESLFTLGLALICWRFASSYIAKKIEEATPEPPEKEEDDDNEFGGAAQLGRIHTLLPMLRKVLGTVLVVMVILTVLSSLGVNIAPLLAGAGVLGLAIGFGAQKLVSDILSGFFFLLDDAFRVGEYVQAGSIRGTVETITLRNVMLRHHLGMLQIVPHSDLGAVTNYMRGGIIMKFPLEFPYDTNIDLVRKIIKKVGIAMLQDEEIGDDFIRPIKSQGVHEITNSVMVIRVKFTAKPGTQFVIKREAFRRITEALNAKGIYYAHRKVIVDFPHEEQKGAPDEATKRKALEAGAASAAIIAAEAEQLKQAEEEKKGG